MNGHTIMMGTFLHTCDMSKERERERESSLYRTTNELVWNDPMMECLKCYTMAYVLALILVRISPASEHNRPSYKFRK